MCTSHSSVAAESTSNCQICRNQMVILFRIGASYVRNRRTWLASLKGVVYATAAYQVRSFNSHIIAFKLIKNLIDLTEKFTTHATVAVSPRGHAAVLLLFFFVFIENFIQHTFSSKKAIYRNSCRTLLLHWGFLKVEKIKLRCDFAGHLTSFFSHCTS